MLYRAIPQRHSHRHPFHATPVGPRGLRTMVYAAVELVTGNDAP